APTAANATVWGLLAGALCCVPLAIDATAHLVRSLPLGAPGLLAAAEVLRSRGRAFALVATTTMAVAGYVAIAGSVEVYRGGLQDLANGLTAGSTVWITPETSPENPYRAIGFNPNRALAILHRLPNVDSARPVGSTFSGVWGDQLL